MDNTTPCEHEWTTPLDNGEARHHQCQRPHHPEKTAHECACGSSLLIGRDF